MIAQSNKEWLEAKDIKNKIKCPHCTKIHKVKHSELSLLQYYKCKKDIYLIGFKGKEI